MTAPVFNRILMAVAVLLALAASAYLWSSRQHAASGPAGEREILYWTDPMVPGYRSDKPGKSPFMDMDLVPVYAQATPAGARDPGVVSISPVVSNNLGVRTHTVRREDRPRHLTAYGYLFREPGSGALLAVVDIFDDGADWVRAGLQADITLQPRSGRAWPGRVESLQPDIDIGSRSLKARIRLLGGDATLRPNMFVAADIQSKPLTKRLIVPRQALIRTGTRSVVVLALGDGRFKPVDVIPGIEFDDWVEIAQGLAEGDQVVVSGQFLIDSESNLQASFARMSPDAGHAGH